MATHGNHRKGSAISSKEKIMKITATIIAKDEEKNLPSAIHSVKDLVDEIVVVVDSRTADKTREAAAKFGAKCYLRDFDNFAGQKNFAVGQARGDWILSLDADEEIPAELVEEIRKAVKSDEFDGYLIPRRNFLLGREIKHTRWSPDKHIWLWKKEKGRWQGRIHEELIVSGKIGELKNAKIHNSYKTISEFLDMVNSYTEFEAEEKIRKGEKFNLIKAFCEPVYVFLLRYVYKKGFLDGWQGFILSYLMGIYSLTTWVKVWEKEE